MEDNDAPTLTSNNFQDGNGEKLIASDTGDCLGVPSSKANSNVDTLELQCTEGSNNGKVWPISGSFEEVGNEKIKEAFKGENTNSDRNMSLVLNWESDPFVWLPPEPEVVEDDMENSVAYNDDDDYIDGTKWSQPSSFNSFGGEHGIGHSYKEERKKAMLMAMNGQFKFLVSRFLASEGVTCSKEDGESWLDIVASLSWEAALLVKPDATEGSAMDPSSYVKVKCVAYGSRSKSEVINGLVFKKNTAHKHMPTKFTKPRVILLKGVLGGNAAGLSSFNTLPQEKDYLKSVIEMIETCHTNVVLVEKTVSRDVQESLLGKGITLVFDMKLSRLKKLARCMGSPIISADEITPNTKLGQCDYFYIEKFIEEHNQLIDGGKKASKTLMFFKGCPKPLGCTILLKGAPSDELKRVKRVMHYTIFAAYHLILETSFFVDQGVISLDTHSVEGKNPCTTKLDSSGRSIAAESSSNLKAEVLPGPANSVDILVSDGTLEKSDLELAKLNSDVDTEGYFADITSNGSPMLKDMHPDEIDINRVDQFENHHDLSVPLLPGQFVSSISASLKRLGNGFMFGSSGVYRISSYLGFYENDQDSPHLHNDSPPSEMVNIEIDMSEKFSEEKTLDETPEDIKIESVSDLNESFEHVADPSNIADMPQKDDIDAMLDPQSILVLISSRSIKDTVCEQSRLTRIKYYGNFDMSLGRFLQDILLSQKPSCAGCGESPEYHTYCYTHQNGKITVQVKHLSESRLPGEKEGKIWMWTRCLKCQLENGIPEPTRRVVMSTAARGLSFGKFLELSFSSHSAARRLSRCGHLLHRDCLRFFGLGSKVAMFRYAPVEIYAACKPPPMLEFSSPIGCKWFEQEAKYVQMKGDQLFREVESILSKMRPKLSEQAVNLPGSTREISDVEAMLRQEKSEFERVTSGKGFWGQATPAIFDLTYLNQELLIELYVWDCRLQAFLSYITDNDAPVSSFTNEQFTDGKSSLNDGEEENNNMKTDEKDVDIPSPTNTSNIQESLTGYSYLSSSFRNDIDENSPVYEPLGNRSDDASEFLHAAVAENPEAGNTGGVNGLVIHESMPSVPDEKSQTSFSMISDDPDSFPIQVDKDNSRESEHMKQSKSTDFDVDIDDASGSAEVLPTSTGFYSRHGPVNIIVEGPEDWIWNPLPEIRKAFWKDHQNGYSQRFEFIFRYSPEYLSPLPQQMIVKERERLCYPVGTGGIVISVHEEEVSSIIASALVLYEDQYIPLDEKDSAIGRGEMANNEEDMNNLMMDASMSSFWSSSSLNLERMQSFQSLSSVSSDDLSSSEGSLFVDRLLSSENWHPEIHLGAEKTTGKSKYSVVCIYAKQFHTLRKGCCPSEIAYISSLSRCKKWDAQGGKSKALFAKTLDDRFIIKEIKKTELASFLKFAPEYFKHVSYSLRTGSQTCLAKILGIYQVRQIKGGKEVNIDLMVMENLLFGHNVSRTYDLKGAVFSRYISDPNNPDAVLLDQNFVEDMGLSPMYVGGRTKHLFQRAIWNDTSFLTSINVMDYSLLVGVDTEHHQLVFGIIDYLRQYTWDKQLETWVKSSLVVPKNSLPTVVSPKDYKKRFRKFMSKYFLTVPDSWTSERCLEPCRTSTDTSIESSQTRSADLHEN